MLSPLFAVHQGQDDSRRMRLICEYGDRGLVVVGRMGTHDVGNECLRIAVVKRKPRALHLNYDGVSLLKDVIDRMQAISNSCGLFAGSAAGLSKALR